MSYHLTGRRTFGFSLFVIIVILICLIDESNGVVVDGTKKKSISATKQQSHENTMIDSFNSKNCGIADINSNDHEFVSMAREGQFPWMVSFQIKTPENTTKSELDKYSKESNLETQKKTGKRIRSMHFCGGSFIADKWILSAAHCFASDSIKNYLEHDKLLIVAGSHKVSARDPLNRNLTIERIYYHSRYDKSMPVGFDIALVELKDKVEFNPKRAVNGFGEQTKPYMNAICLPLNTKKYNYNETARVAGWGLSSEKDETSMPSKLLMTDILIAKKDVCLNKYIKSMKSDKPAEQSKKYDDFICAGYKNDRDACQSDSGGPLMEYADRKAVAIGIVSYGIGCATKGVPGIYTRTSAYINWIKDLMQYGKEAAVAFKVIDAKR